MPRPAHVQQFKQLYQQRSGDSLSDKQALEQLISLLTIFRYQQENAKYQSRLQHSMKLAATNKAAV